jgi:hypothetical protein
VWAVLFPSWLVPGLALAAGVLAGAVLGLFVRIRPSALLAGADRALGTHGLASAALDLTEGRRSSAFADAVVVDAAAALHGAGAQRILGSVRLPFLPWVGLLAAAVTAITFLPFSLRDLFPTRPGVDRELVLLGGELEESGRRLEESSRSSDLRRGLELSQELQQLGRDLQMQQEPAEELSRRLGEMESRLSQEYRLVLQRFNEQKRPTGTGTGENAPEGGDQSGAPGADAGSGREDNDGQGTQALDRSGVPPDAKALAEALDLLQQLKERSAARGQGAGSTGDGAGPEGRPGDEPGDGMPGGGGDPMADDGAGGERSSSSAPGTTPVQDEKGPGSEIAKAKTGELLKVDAPVGEGDMARTLVRALPEATRARTPEEQVLGEYRRQAESALAAEQVPLGLRGYVKAYFLGIGVLTQ